MDVPATADLDEFVEPSTMLLIRMDGDEQVFDVDTDEITLELPEPTIS